MGSWKPRNLLLLSLQGSYQSVEKVRKYKNELLLGWFFERKENGLDCMGQSFITKKTWRLNISSLKDSNHVLLAKWWWRFRVEPNALWCKVIKSTHGTSSFKYGGLNHLGTSSNSTGLWKKIANRQKDFLKSNIVLPKLFKRKLMMGKTLCGMIIGQGQSF